MASVQFPENSPLRRVDEALKSGSPVKLRQNSMDSMELPRISTETKTVVTEEHAAKLREPLLQKADDKSVLRTVCNFIARYAALGVGSLFTLIGSISTPLGYFLAVVGFGLGVIGGGALAGGVGGEYAVALAAVGVASLVAGCILLKTGSCCLSIGTKLLKYSGSLSNESIRKIEEFSKFTPTKAVTPMLNKAREKIQG